MASRRRSETFFKGFLGLSALAHLNLLLFISAFMSLYPESCSSHGLDFTPFEVSLVSQESMALQAEQELEKLKEELKEEEEKEEEKEKDEKGQVVELPPPPEEKRPDRSRFLSEYDSSVNKETKGKPVPFKAGSLRANRPLPQVEPQPPPTPPPAPITPKPKKQQAEKEQPQKEPLELAMRSQPDVPRSDLPDSPTGDAPAQVDPPGPELPRGPTRPEQPAAGPEQPRSLRELSMKELSRALGSKVNDYLPDVDNGESTLLNSKRWRFATFFNRIKRQVSQKWHPGRVYRRRDPGGNVYGFKDRLTILRVRLSPGGQVKELHLETASGVGFLDDEALSAFRAAGPFPNPPKGLIKDETISFRFGFLFEISRKPTFRIFRQ